MPSSRNVSRCAPDLSDRRPAFADEEMGAAWLKLDSGMERARGMAAHVVVEVGAKFIIFLWG
jgi:hypothetical protein